MNAIKTLKRINKLVNDPQSLPLEGIGKLKPKVHKDNLSGFGHVEMMQQIG